MPNEISPHDADPAGQHRGRGRPRDEHADVAILDATVKLLSERGLTATTMDAVARHAGVARATVYLRWPTHDALIVAAGRHAMRRPPYDLTGDLERDLHIGSRYAARVFSEPAVAAILPELMRAVLSTPPAISFDSLAPNRRALSAEYRELAASQGFRTDVEPEVGFDIVLGAHISHILAVGSPPSQAYADLIADVVVAGLRSGGHPG